MRPIASSPDTQCPNCGANVAAQADACPACGAPLSATRISQPALRQLLEASNQSLVKSGASAAESAFGIGCSLGGIATLVLVLATFILGGRDWTSLAIVALVAVLISTGVAAILAARARAATVAATYRRVVAPEIEKYVRANQITRPEFDALAVELVPEGAPLRSYLAPSSEPERDETMPEK
jgi:hypothetical protein